MASQRIRSAFSIGLLWAVAWAVGGAALMANHVLFEGSRPVPVSWHVVGQVSATGFLFGICGLIAGVAFAAALAQAERNKQLETLSSLRVAIWGFLGGGVAGIVVFSLFGATRTSALVVGAVSVGILSSLFAVGSLALARTTSPGGPHVA